MSTSAHQLARNGPRQPLIARKHTDYGELEIPYYDEELGVAQGRPHKDVVFFIGDALRRIADLAGLGFLADNPIWYRSGDKQKAFYSDLALAQTEDLDSVTADHIMLACEVVTTTHAAKMKKDTVKQLKLNEDHNVPEFLLFYPDMDDAKVFEWFVLVNGSYTMMQPIKGRYVSRAIPGLVLEQLPRSEWRRSRKCRIFFKNVPMLASEDEHHARLDAEDGKRRAQGQTEIAYNRASKERDEREKERRRADEAEQRADEAEQRAEKEYRARLALEQRLAELEGKA